MLYAKDAKVYIAARSEAKAQKTIDEIKALHPASAGELVFLKLDLSDLTTIKASAKEFLAKESRLDVLWNNAGVMVPPQGSKTVQGSELQVGTNNIHATVTTSSTRDRSDRRSPCGLGIIQRGVHRASKTHH
jgi:retinol dehydrogenase-12